MYSPLKRRRPGEIRDAIVEVLSDRQAAASVRQITDDVVNRIGAVPPSSIRSYLRLNTPQLFARTERAQYRLNDLTRCCPHAMRRRSIEVRMARRFCMAGPSWFKPTASTGWPRDSVQAVVTDPPYGLVEYSAIEQQKLRLGRGGLWRIPPSFDGASRSPLPRFTTLTPNDLDALDRFFRLWGRSLLRVLVPGANVVVASNPLLSYIVSGALVASGLERRGELARLTMTMRGGDRPKAAHVEFNGVSVMPRSMWEPWLLFRKPLDGRVQDNLRRWGTGGFRRVSASQPFGDVIASAPTRPAERKLAPHPSLKPHSFMRRVVRGVLPLGVGVVLDPFAGSGSTLAAAEAVGYDSVGVERDNVYFKMACDALPRLAALRLPTADGEGAGSR